MDFPAAKTERFGTPGTFGVGACWRPSLGRVAMSPPRLRKALGQHHLRHGAACRPAIEFLRARDRTVVEIGPGGGVLTRQLLDAGATVLAWELDMAWAMELRWRLSSDRLRVVAGDALALPWERLAPGTLVAGNLPYAVATPILERWLLRGGASLPRAVFLVQDEVAQRLVAAPATHAYGFLTVTTAALASVSVLARVEPGSFRPAPKVHGAFVGIERHAPVVAPQRMDRFRATVAQSFAHRRKTIANSLAAALGRDAAHGALAAAGIDPKRRAETLTLDEFVTLDRALGAIDPRKNL
jgi:16S rRNA (adenine1518-N6/adenine1519-N6)-dimethyltransferase